MSNFINKEEALKAIKDSAFGFTYEVGEAYEAVKELVPIDLEEKGKWIRRKNEDCWECSQCHAVLENFDIALHNFYYCYHCGANMQTIDGWMNIENN